jgi:MFS transporter, ACS family, glucarate transporter
VQPVDDHLSRPGLLRCRAPAIAADLKLASIADLKWAFTAFAIAYAIFEIPAGWWGDRNGPRGILIRIVLWWSACTALTGVVGWTWEA